MSKFQSPLLNFAEAVLAKESGVQEEQTGLIVGPLEAGWELTPGSKACDEERSGVKRRCRPFNHTAE